jgi:hypothetical protein
MDKWGVMPMSVVSAYIRYFPRTRQTTVWSPKYVA